MLSRQLQAARWMQEHCAEIVFMPLWVPSEMQRPADLPLVSMSCWSPDASWVGLARKTVPTLRKASAHNSLTKWRRPIPQ